MLAHVDMYFCRVGSSCQWELLNTDIPVILLVGFYTSNFCSLPVEDL
ncbi:hypothetical protein SLEP1_g26396 [Rubroshorea leprosula]|uniref:Uncharacterized protein n=1 Tax=Rubroshorea leprosula TaxID=152421 RepID=A0AAV5JSC6_9ROSI|nr:hypothetical protein SLEP1_g26396 [Rubroshorea leprosula]